MTGTDTDLPPESSLLIRAAQLPGRGIFDLRIEDDRIVALAECLQRRPGERLLEASGNVLLPGLHDHHLHLFASAAARESLFCGPPAVSDEFQLAEVLGDHPGDDWIRGIGFHESVYARLDRYWLDAVCPTRPVRIQHRSGMLWVVNSCALERLSIAEGENLPRGVERAPDGTLTGGFYDLDGWLGARLDRCWPSLDALSADLASFGITAVTDTGARNGRSEWGALCGASERNELLQRLLVMGNEELAGVSQPSTGLISIGPLKIYLREVDLPDLEDLVMRVQRAHAGGRAVAIHCVTLVELRFALSALNDAGPISGDRIEHAAIADDHALQMLAELGVTVVTQPQFLVERGAQYLRDVEPDDIPLLYRGRGFLSFGVALAAGSDAPYGSTDPWAAMRAAVERRTRDGVQMSSVECLTPAQAVALYAGNQQQPGSGLRELAVGQPADLCLLEVPWDTLCLDLDARHVSYTLRGGQIIYQRFLPSQ